MVQLRFTVNRVDQMQGKYFPKGTGKLNFYSYSNSYYNHYCYHRYDYHLVAGCSTASKSQHGKPDTKGISLKNVFSLNTKVFKIASHDSQLSNSNFTYHFTSNYISLINERLSLFPQTTEARPPNQSLSLALSIHLKPRAPKRFLTDVMSVAVTL